MAKRALTWNRAAAIAWRDLKSAPGKFAFVVLSVAIGVAALVGVRGFSESFRRTLTTEARSLMAGDLSARIFRQPTSDETQKIADLDKKDGGAQSTWVVEYPYSSRSRLSTLRSIRIMARHSWSRRCLCRKRCKGIPQWWRRNSSSG
jgi:predicted lysophospholipase L1 biosynthesis ABC-type transport system permease subunit